MSDATLAQIKRLNAEYRGLTGEDAYLYASQPATTTLYTFVTAPRPFTTSGSALAHMVNVLEQARAGWTSDEIVNGRQKRSQTVNRGAW